MAPRKDARERVVRAAVRWLKAFRDYEADVWKAEDSLERAVKAYLKEKGGAE